MQKEEIYIKLIFIYNFIILNKNNIIACKKTKGNQKIFQ
jgi:hypothetical protein